jgi:hypothetical protein
MEWPCASNPPNVWLQEQTSFSICQRVLLCYRATLCRRNKDSAEFWMAGHSTLDAILQGTSFSSRLFRFMGLTR